MRPWSESVRLRFKRKCDSVCRNRRLHHNLCLQEQSTRCVTVQPENISDLFPQARKIEFKKKNHLSLISLSLHLVSSLLFHLLLSFLVPPLPSSRFFSFLSSSLVFSRPSSFIFSFLLCLSFSVSLCLCLCLRVVLLFGVCRCGRGVCLVRVCCGTLKKREKNHCGFKNASVCAFKTSPCMPAPRAHVFQHVRVVPVHTGTF